MIFLKKKISVVFFMVLLLLFSFSFCQNVGAQTIIPRGPVRGIWDPGGNPYYITGDIWIPSVDTLIIKAGVEVLFVGAYYFEINGLFRANGTADNMITFHGNGAKGSWKGFWFTDSTSDGCILDYCIIKDGGFNNWSCIYILNNDTCITISNSEIHNCTDNGLDIRSYIYTNGEDSITKICKPTIANNCIYDNGGNGIFVYAYYQETGHRGDYNSLIASPIIKNNVIHTNSSYGIRCYLYAKRMYCWCYPEGIIFQTNPIIQQNTIYENGIDGIKCNKTVEGSFGGMTGIEVNPLITSNIVAKNKKCGLNGNNEVSAENVRFNDFWGNGRCDVCGVWDWPDKIIIRTNLNGDSCDFNWNIYLDPQFVDEANYDFHLKNTSPCIDAGDLSLGWDPDGTFPEIGAFYYPYPDAILIINNRNKIPTNYTLNQNYPNPFNPETFISFQVPKTSHIKIKVFNLLGQHIRTLVDEEKSPGSYQIFWNGLDEQGNAVGSGVYLYKMQAGDFTAMKKMVLVR